MNKRLLSVVAFALVISAIASLVLYRLISTKLVDSAKAATIQVAVANRDLEIGTLLKDGDLTIADWSGPQPRAAMLKPVDIVGRGVVATIYEGEPILDTRLAPRGAGAGLAATIPVGMRAVAVHVNDVVGVAGFVVPGMRVDILIAGNPPLAPVSLGTQTKTLLQNIEVLSAGQNIQKDTEGKPVSVQVVNLLVNPVQAETLSLASNETRIQLILRNPLDTDTVTTPGTAIANLFSGNTGLPQASRPGTVTSSRPRVRLVAVSKPIPAGPPEPAKIVIPVVTVEVFRGSTLTEIKVQPGSKQ
jgi:pilus assembly protein CpaB